jgi:hypothetical protein
MENFGVIEIYKSSDYSSTGSPNSGCSCKLISSAIKIPHILNFAKVNQVEMRPI